MSAVLAVQLSIIPRGQQQVELRSQESTPLKSDPQFNYTNVIPIHSPLWEVPSVIQEEFSWSKNLASRLDQIFKNLGSPNWQSHLAEFKEVRSLLEELVASQDVKPYELESPIVERLIAVLVHNPHFVIRQEAASNLAGILVDLDERLPIDEDHSKLLQDLKERVRKLTRTHVYGISERVA